MDAVKSKEELRSAIRAVWSQLYEGKGVRLAEDLGIGQSTMSRILRGVPKTRSPYKRVYQKIIDELGQAAVKKALQPVSGEPITFEQDGDKSVVPEKLRSGLEEMRVVTFYPVRAGAGHNGEIAIDERGVEIKLQSLLLRQILGSPLPEDIGCFILNGESMEPEVRDGSIVFFRPAEKIPDAGRYVIALNDELMLKYVQRRAGGIYRIKSAHQNYDPEDLQQKGEVFKSLDSGATVTFRLIGKYLQALHPSDFQEDLSAQRVAQALYRSGLINDPNQN